MAKALHERLAQLARLGDVSGGRVPQELTDRTLAVLSRAGERLRFGPVTVVAMAGATGSGKSSLFNAVTGTTLAQVGVRRPTTSTTLAASFGSVDSDLFDWLEIGGRAEVAPLAEGAEDLLLLDLPDHDSVELDHRREAERVLEVADQFCWVLDPQKYADAAVHERYLRPLASHRDVILVVLNQADRLSPADLNACLKDLHRLLDDDGLGGVPVLATSATTGQGIPELRKRFVDLARRKQAMVTRLQADVDGLVMLYDDATAGGAPTSPPPELVKAMNTGLARAAGVPLVVDAVHASMLRRGQLATGWPITKWMLRLRPDPLRRFRLGSRPKGEPAAITQRTSLPGSGGVVAAQLNTTLRNVTTSVGDQLPPHWRPAIRDAVNLNGATLPDSLDRAVAEVDLAADRQPMWWQLFRLLQWLLIAAVVAGGLWLLVNAILSYFMIPRIPVIPIELWGGWQVPLPTIMVFGGLVTGVVLSGLGRIFVGAGARSKARRARRVLDKAVAKVGEQEIIAPVQAELERHAEARKLVRSLQG